MGSKRQRALYLGLLFVALIAGTVAADLLGLTAVVVVLLMLGVGIELFFWVTLVQGDDTTSPRSR